MNISDVARCSPLSVMEGSGCPSWLHRQKPTLKSEFRVSRVEDRLRFQL